MVASKRTSAHVHSVFEGEDTTVGGYIRRSRLAACRETLESAGPSLSLTDIALRWGFYDLSHMTRCFNREYGAPPRRFLLQLRDGEACSPASSSYKGDARSD
jgi:transcriptional regulator GlxA family with amidase domain